MTTTPRPTELCAITWRHWLDDLCSYPRDEISDHRIGDRRFARDTKGRIEELERELAAANARVEELMKWKGEVIDRLIAKRIVKPEHDNSPKLAVHALLGAAANARAEANEKDARRFRHLQSIDFVKAQQFFWNFSSRLDRAKAIDAAIAASREGA